MTSNMDEIFKRVLNDRDIFWIKKEIFSKDEWKKLKEAREKPDEFNKIVDNKIEVMENKMNSLSDKDKGREVFEKSIELCHRLKSAIKEKPNIIKQMFDNLGSYGLIQCNLPSMDDYGKGIERYGISTVEQFFLDKMKRENDPHKKKALEKVLEYVKELYNANLSALEIAYFIRKLDSITILWEV